MMKDVGFLIDDCFLLHDPGNRHPESPARLRALQEALKRFGAVERWQRIEPRLARLDEVELVHNSAHLESVRQASLRAPAFLDADTAVSSESYRTGLLAVGGVLNCMGKICGGMLKRAFAFVRPPGHHAEPGRAMGFCLFNNIALAAAFARLEYRLERVAIVDFDLHHGNGSQAAFYDDPQVLYISSHQYPYYPGTGASGEIGTGKGRGFTVNFPLPAGTGDDVFGSVYTEIVVPILEQFQPELILVSAGFDAYFKDPLGGLEVTADGYAAAAASLIKAADLCSDGKICFVLEGGYSEEGLQEGSRAVMSEMESDKPREFPHTESPAFHHISKMAKGVLGGFWKW
jgi:acetoin utilization deacetylase AcuC-like enzyme